MKREKNLLFQVNIQNWSEIKSFLAVLEEKKPPSLRVECLPHHSSKEDGRTDQIFAQFLLSTAMGGQSPLSVGSTVPREQASVSKASRFLIH